MNDYYYQIIKDIGDYRRKVGQPAKILMKQEVYDNLMKTGKLSKNSGEYKVADTSIKITESINKDWVIV